MSQLFTSKHAKLLFPVRDADSNKGDYGRVTLIGGCTQYSGAVRLAEMACSAMRSGAGICRVAAPKSLEQILLPQILESIYYPLSDVGGDLLFNEAEFEALIKKSDVIAFGMGVGKSEETKKAVSYLLSNYEGILIVDADGINCMAELGKKALIHHKCRLVLTPHPKEFSRLAKVDIEKVLEEPEENATHLAAYLNAVVLLKGHRTYISDGRECRHVEKGGAGMATAGSGDVLSGIAAAVLACNKDNLFQGVCAAAYINGAAGEIAQKQYGDVGMIASDTAKSIAAAIEDVRCSGGLPHGRALIVLLIAAAVLLGVFGVSKLPAAKEETAQVQEETESAYVVSMDFLMKDIYIDGVLINNYQLYRPFGSYDGHIYVPLTEDVCKALGIEASWEIYGGDLVLNKIDASGEGAFYDVHGWDLAPIKGWAKPAMELSITSGGKKELLETESKDIISNNDGETMYLRINLLEESSLLDVSLYYDDYTGLYISTDPKKPAEGYYCQNNADYILGRADYISSFPNGLTLGDGVYYEYIFRHESNTKSVDEDLVLAMARTESSFYRQAQSAAGARGLMQIMPDTAKAYGINPDDLYEVHTSVRFGAKYISEALYNFGGDTVKALSSYNFGGNAVLAGQYDTGYANKVLKNKADMESSIASKGYSNQFQSKVEYHQ